MSEHILTRKLNLLAARETVFEFFADARNLERITPPELNFEIETPPPIKMEKGTLIDYRLSLRGLPIRWRTLISEWDPPNRFTDEALRSPYKQWIHQHIFSENSDGETIIEDVVRYRLPFEPFGDLGHWIVRRELNNIFDYRQRAVLEIMEVNGKIL